MRPPNVNQPGQRHPISRIDAALAVERLMAAVLGRQHLSQRTRTAQAAFDPAVGRWNLHNDIATSAG